MPGPIPGVVQNPVVWKISAVSPLQMAIFGLIPHVFKNCVNGLEIYGKFMGNIWDIAEKHSQMGMGQSLQCGNMPAKLAVTRLLLTCLAANSTTTFQGLWLVAWIRWVLHIFSLKMLQGRSAEDCRVRVIWIIDPTKGLFEAGIRKQQLQGYYIHDITLL